MSRFKTWRKFPTRQRPVLFTLIIFVVLITAVRTIVPPPAAVGMHGKSQSASLVRFFHDDSWINELGERQLSQTLFDAVIAIIRDAEKVIVLDMFLFNSWQGPVPELHRLISDELTDVLLEQKKHHPQLQIIVISDPINTVYGGLPSVHFDRLEAAGVHVVLTNLTQLQDSNPIWSSFWRFVIRPFGNGEGSLLPNPFGEGRVSLRSYLALLNFKANHRKLIVADTSTGDWTGFVSSANPHDGSSAHRNIAIQFDGVAVQDLLQGERALLEMNKALPALRIVDQVLSEFAAQPKPIVAGGVSDADASKRIRVVSESQIHRAALIALESVQAGDDVDLAMFYLSERQIIKALKMAAERGARVRVLLDINNDAFGRQKNGVPNRPVAAELVKAGVQVRWCTTLGEQCHAKGLHVRHADEHVFLLGSANFTRRNLMDLNMETDVELTTTLDDPVALEMVTYFNDQWNNRPGRTYSADYQQYSRESIWLTIQYRLMEVTGLSTF